MWHVLQVHEQPGSRRARRRRNVRVVPAAAVSKPHASDAAASPRRHQFQVSSLDLLLRMKCGQRVRSRSSPVRYRHMEEMTLGGVEHRARSPSVSPPRPASPVGSIAREGKAVSAYFSTHVPAEPVRLVTATRPATWHIFCTDPVCTVLQKHNGTEKLCVVGNIPREVCAPSLGGSVATSAALASATTPTTPSVPSVPSPCLSRKLHESITMVESQSPATQSEPADAPISARRDVAVQAQHRAPLSFHAAPDLHAAGRRRLRRDRVSAAKHEYNAPLNDTVERIDEAREWVGGVRALRDSHVRLVLRELRHIERLNRALDTAGTVTSTVAAPAVTATVSDVPRAAL